MSGLHILRVFVNEDGEWGNPLGVFLDGGSVPEADRQGVAADLDFSETVFVEDLDRGRMRIHTPTVELPFAGHPTVGTAWLLADIGSPAATLRPPAGEVGVRCDGDEAYVTANPDWAPGFELTPLRSPAALRDLDPLAAVMNTYAWAWIDEAAGTVRARAFVPEAGIVEDEATGSAAIRLCARLGRTLVIHQGNGSVMRCAPAANGTIEVGGRVRQVEFRRSVQGSKTG